MDATIHAVLLLAMLPLSMGLLALVGSRPQSASEWGWAVLIGVGAFMASLSVLGVSASTCLPNPLLQWLLPAILAGICAATARTWKIRAGIVVLFIFIGVFLDGQYRSLLRTGTEYVAMEGNHRASPCSGPAKGVKLWHSSLTGLYGVKPDVPRN